jgi:hypothetical protein
MLLWTCEWEIRDLFSSKEVSLKEKEYEKEFLTYILLFKLKKVPRGK